VAGFCGRFFHCGAAAEDDQVRQRDLLVEVLPDLFERIPLRRDFYAVARVAPGTTEDTVGTIVYGSSSAENQYIIDGLNTTGVEVGDKGKTLNFDFVQEVEVKTGGLPAEYGRMTGGVLNVITKSGSNLFKGSGFVNGEGGFLNANDDTRDKRPAWTTTVTDVSSRSDFGGELGGPIATDRFWFFGAYNRTNENRNTTVIREIESPGSPGINSEVPTSIDRDLFAAKLTYRIAPGQTLNGTIMGDPSTRDGAVFTIAGPESTWKGALDSGGTDYVAKYAGVFGSRFLLNGMYARHNESQTYKGPGRDIPLSIDATVTPNANSGGFGFFQDQDFKRDVYKADASSYLGAHDLKVGVDREHVRAVNNNYNGGAGQRIYKLRTSTGIIYYRHRYYVNDRGAGYDRNVPSTWQIALPLTSEPDSYNTSFYGQDSWKVGAGLTVNAGIRWEGQNVRNRDKETAFDLKDNWAPRVGFVWDVARNNRSKLYANWGRFFESIPMDINIRSFGGEVQCFCYNLSPDPANYLQDPAAPRAQSLLGGATPADPGLKGQYIDEALVGFEYDLGRNLVVGAKYGHRKLGRVIEDFLIPSEGTYFIANPGSGVGTEMGFYDGVHTAPAPQAKRTNDAFEVNARKRFSNNWQFLASAVRRMGHQVQFQVGNAQHAARLRLAPAQQHFHPCGHLIGCERLGEVVIAAGTQATHAFVHVAQRTDHQHRGIHAAVPQRRHHVDAVHARQHAVQGDDVVVRAAGPVQAVLAVGDPFGGQAVQVELGNDLVRGDRVVFDDQCALHPTNLRCGNNSPGSPAQTTNGPRGAAVIITTFGRIRPRSRHAFSSWHWLRSGGCARRKHRIRPQDPAGWPCRLHAASGAG